MEWDELRGEEIEMTKRKGIIDRFDRERVVVEFDKGMEDILKSRFPELIQPGDVAWFDEDGTVEVDPEERERLSKEIYELMDEL